MVIILWFLFKIILAFNLCFPGIKKFSPTSNLVNYTFVSRTETFLSSLPDFFREWKLSGSQKFYQIIRKATLYVPCKNLNVPGFFKGKEFTKNFKIKIFKTTLGMTFPALRCLLKASSKIPHQVLTKPIKNKICMTNFIHVNHQAKVVDTRLNWQIN